jgi:hypothetical protein
MSKIGKEEITFTEQEEYSKKLLALRMSKTAPNLIKNRKGKGGREYKYVTKHAGYRWLDKHYPGLWSFEIKDKFFDRMYYTHGSLVIKDPVTGFLRKFEDYGIAELIVKNEDGTVLDQMYYKTSASDAFKRCCVQAAAFNDVYSDDEEGFSDLPDIRWEKLLPHITKAKENFTDEQIGNQFVYLISGTLSEEQLLGAWNVNG